MTWLLRPGVGVARRDADHLQLGTDPPLIAVLPRTSGVRRLLREVAAGAPLSTLDATARTALQTLVGAQLVVPADAEAVRAERRSRHAVHLDVPDRVLPAAVRLLTDAGVGRAGADERAAAALVWAEGEVPRDRVDGWMRSGTPHLVVRELVDGPVVGPFVVPGATACLRCVDAHAGESDPRRALVVEQLATIDPLRPPAPDPALSALALAWAVCELASAADGRRPASWSATVALGALPPVVTAYRRHLHCGCAWAEELAVPRTEAAAG